MNKQHGYCDIIIVRVVKSCVYASTAVCYALNYDTYNANKIDDESANA